MKLLICFILILNLLNFSNGQWSNFYRYPSTTNCTEGEAALISNRMDACIGIVKYSCNSNSTTEKLYNDNDCLIKSNTVTFENYICEDGQTVNCTDQVSLPSNSYVMAIYSTDAKNCADDSEIIQYNTIPLNVCWGGVIYQCDSNVLTTEKYNDDQCTKLINKSQNNLTCQNGNEIYSTYLNFYCTN